MKKRIVGAMNASCLSWDEESERAVELIAGFAVASMGEPRKIGGILWHLKYNGELLDVALLRDVEVLVTRKLARRLGILDIAMFGQVVRAALGEWLQDQCRKCGGRGRTGFGREIIETRRLPCKACGGEGSTVRHGGALSAMCRESGAIIGNEVPDVRFSDQCEPCSGRGWRAENSTRYSKLKVCKKCRGSGLRRLVDDARAKLLRVSFRVYRQSYKAAYHQALRELRATDIELALRIDFMRGRGENPDHTSIEVEVAAEEAATDSASTVRFTDEDAADARAATDGEVAS